MKPGRLLLVLAGGVGGLSVLLLGLAVWGLEHSYEWELARCAALPDHYAPEWGWLLVIAPLAMMAMTGSGLAVLIEIYRRPKEALIPWAVLGLSGLLSGTAAVLVALYFLSSCPPIH